MTSIEPAKLRSGMKLVQDGQLWVVASFQHVSPGKGQAFVTAKLKNLVDGRVIERTFNGSEQPVLADFEQRSVQFLYNDDMGFHFMDLTTYDQHMLSGDEIGDKSNFMIPEVEGIMAFWEGRPVSFDLPPKMVFEVTDTIDEIIRGNTANSVTKDATIETGYTLKVPPFVKRGEKIRVSTETGEYVERA